MTTQKKSAAEKKKALTDYESRLLAVKRLKEMTDTGAWQRFYASMNRIKDEAAKTILVAEKPRDMIVCQERIKAVDHILKEIQEPIDELNSFCHNMPLFAGSFHTRASWNVGIGIVELSEIDTKAAKAADAA